MKLLSAFLLGLVFALGLGLGGMTQPTKVIGFLDVAGQWDATLAFVMGGAAAVSMVMFPLILKRSHPVLAERFVLPVKKRIDFPLAIGAGLFGIGWGLSGYCPGPALVCLVTLSQPVLVFVGFMVAGLYFGRRFLVTIAMVSCHRSGKTVPQPLAEFQSGNEIN
jgi:uncharacterized protein